MIKEFRRKYGLTQRALAELMGVTITTVYSWEAGLRNLGGPAKKLLERIEMELEKKLAKRQVGKGVKKHGKRNLQKR